MCPAGERGKEFLQNLGYDFFYCGGKGTCGKCKGKVWKGDAGKLSKAEQELLTEKEKTENIRLLCQIEAVTDLELCLMEKETDSTEEKQFFKGESGEKEQREKRTGAAFDIGTTTVAGALFDLDTGRRIMEMTAWNPQGCFGADLISRMQYCLEQADGMEKMQQKIVGCMNEMLRGFEEKTGRKVNSVTAAGNSAMTHFLLGERVDTLARVPFRPSFTERQERDGKECGLSVKEGAKLLTLPLLEGQVGGDITAALLSVDIFSRESGTLLVDIGTNGEVAFLWGGNLYICSTAAGPALEGAGISCGMRAQEGAIEKVWLMGGKVYTKVIGGTVARGICGSALIDAIAVLLDLGKIREDGYLPEGNFSLYQGDECIEITQEDVRQFQMVKGAVRAGIETVVHAAGAGMEDIARIYIAGAFGSNLQRQNAVRTGLLPEIPSKKIVAVGNASLKGAGLVLCSEEARRYAERIRGAVILVNLAETMEFQEAYIGRMGFGL